MFYKSYLFRITNKKLTLNSGNPSKILGYGSSKLFTLIWFYSYYLLIKIYFLLKIKLHFYKFPKV